MHTLLIYFLKVCDSIFPYSGIDARIILEQNKFSKILPLIRDWTLDHSTVVLTSFVYSLTPCQLCLNSHCLKDWDFNDSYIVMLYWFQLNILSPTSKVELKSLQLMLAKIAQMARHETVNQSLIKGSFLLNLGKNRLAFCTLLFDRKTLWCLFLNFFYYLKYFSFWNMLIKSCVPGREFIDSKGPM